VQLVDLAVFGVAVGFLVAWGLVVQMVRYRLIGKGLAPMLVRTARPTSVRGRRKLVLRTPPHLGGGPKEISPSEDW
jgi:hypothetical protein